MSDFQPFTDSKYLPFEFGTGTEKIAILVHGFPGTPYEMRLVGEILHEVGYTSRGILLPGFGEDIVNLAEKSRDDWFAHVRQAITRAAAESEEFIVVGYSFGAAVCINVLTTLKVSPTKVIFLAPYWNAFGQYNLFIRLFAPLVWPIGRLFSPSIRVFDDINFSNPRDRQDLELLFDGADLDDPQVQDFIKNITIPFDIIDELYIIGRLAKKHASSINYPVLVLQGSADSVVPMRSTNKLVKCFPNVRYITLDHLTHDFILPDSKNDEVLRDHLLSFLGD